MSYARGVPHIGHTEGQAMFDQEQHPFVRSGGPSFRPDLPSGRAPRTAAVKDAAAKAAPAEPARSVLDRARSVKDAARRLRRCRLRGGILDCRCARRSAREQVGTKGWSCRSNKGMLLLM